MSEFIYERSVAPCGVAVEEIYGAEEKSAKVWKMFALQIFSEASGDYRSIEHLDNGAPLLEGISQRISISHTSHFLAVASIPKTPDINLEDVNVRTAIGIDVEKADRGQVLKVRDKYLNTSEQKIIAQDDVEANILAWTCKEALYKSIMGTASDWKEDYQILKMPEPAQYIKTATKEKFGRGLVRLADGKTIDMTLSSWLSEGHIITLAFTTKIPIYK